MLSRGKKTSTEESGVTKLQKRRNPFFVKHKESDDGVELVE